jgi:hypothetical protein
MQIDTKIGDIEFRASLWGIALFIIGTWLLFTYGDEVLEGFIDAAAGSVAPR